MTTKDNTSATSTRDASRVVAAAVGDAINVCLIVSTVVYVFLVYGHLQGLLDLSRVFGTNWSSDGFCLSFKDTLLHTHLLCLYGDTVLGVAVFFFGKHIAKHRPELKQAADSAFSVVFHGIGHGMLWYWQDQIDTLPPHKALVSANSPAVTGVFLVGAFGFWHSFLGMAFPKVTSKTMVFVQSLLHAAMGVFFVPRMLLFGYVNCVLFANIGLAQLYDGYQGVKDRYYVLTSSSNVPVMIATWAEPILCDGFLIRWGGHIVFDYSIPLSILASLIIASQMEPRETVRAAEKKAE